MPTSSPTAPLALTAPELPTHLLCEVGPLTLGLEALLVREVLAMPLVTPLTQAAPLVAGALNLRGRVVPVLDLRAALELERTAPCAADSLVVLESGERLIAVRVDAVRDVQLLGEVQNVSANHGDEATGFIAGIARQEIELVQLLDLAATFAAALARPDARFGERASYEAIAARAPGLAVPGAAGPTENWRAAWFATRPDERETLEKRARALARPLEEMSAARAGARLMAAAVLGGELFGFDLQWVREFAPLPALARVPLGPPQIKGLLNLRGEILPLLDIRHALGMKAAPIERESDNESASRMEVIVVEHANARVAIWVEGVLDVFAPQSAVAPVAARHEAAELLQGVVPYGDRMLAVLNLPRLLGELMGTSGAA